MNCGYCSRQIPEDSVVCPFCATPCADAPTSAPVAPTPERQVAPDEAVTSLHTDAGPGAPAALSSPAAAGGMSSSDSGQHGRFMPGTIVAERYRIVGLLGRGGMGEVYRADDLKLGQQVALKFLPGRMVADEDHVRRLFDEVRMARKVSHPNVCRVWDVGETEGQHYVSMEYVDGEDLASLLRRIGRLPEDKAVEIARQLCAALAAAHDEGVLHRDLKPANIMLDGRGRVKLTDFGLAAVAEVRAGTPIYMAPEQLAGTEVSVRSDIYSLGLVLHELFTGKRVFEADDFNELSRLHEGSLTTSLTRTSQLDPSVDRVIHRCLEKDPAKRPQTALAVASGLPGADPLAAALAAGETPSPQMVAEAGGEGSLPMVVAAPLLLLVLAGAVVVGVLQSGRSLISQVPFALSPAQMDARAVQVLEGLGYATDFADSASRYSVDLRYLRWLREQEATEARLAVVHSGRSASVPYWWRGSPSVLVPTPMTGASLSSDVTLSNPPRTTAGMVSLQLDTKGRLLWLDAVPERLAGEPSEAEGGPGGATDWQRLFELMDLEIADFRAVPSRLVPEHFADERVAWEGAYPEDSEAPLRIEAAALHGRPTSLRLFTPARPLQPPGSSGNTSSFGLAAAVAVGVVATALLMVLTAVFGGLYVARRNVRSGRGDIRGARRIGFGIASAIGAAWLVSDHTLSGNDINLFIDMLIFVSAAGGVTWALYLAVEPFMRRQAPEALIGWTRFVNGRWGDPLVGRDLLLGCAAGVLARVLVALPQALSPAHLAASASVVLPPESLVELLASLMGTATGFVILALGMLFLYGISFLVLGRRRWVAYGTWLLLLGGVGFVPGLSFNGEMPSASLLTAVLWALGWALWLYVLFRLGILAFLAMAVVSYLLASSLPTLDFSAWYGSSVIAGLVLLAALAIYAFWRCVQWKGGLAEALGGE